jgi:hypothetical protein
VELEEREGLARAGNLADARCAPDSSQSQSLTLSLWSTHLRVSHIGARVNAAGARN